MIPLSEVPENKKLLWFFDDEMTHDLIFVPSGIPHNNFYKDISNPPFDKIILVERATIYRYPLKENWSENLFSNLLYHSTLIKASDGYSRYPTFEYIGNLLLKTYSLSIPATTEKGYCILVYLVPSVEIRNNRIVEIFSLHHKQISLKDQVQQVTIECLTNSAYIISDVPSILSLQQELDDSIDLSTAQLPSLITTERVYTVSSCTVTGFQATSNNFGINDLKLNGEAHITGYESVVTTSASYPEQGAIVYCYPFHPYLVNFQIPNNLVVGNIRLKDFNYLTVLGAWNYNIYMNIIEDWAEQSSGLNRTIENFTMFINHVQQFILGVQSVTYFTNGYLNSQGVIRPTLINWYQDLPITESALTEEIFGISPRVYDINRVESKGVRLFRIDYPEEEDSDGNIFIRDPYIGVLLFESVARCQVQRDNVEVEVLTKHWASENLDPYISNTWYIRAEKFHQSNEFLYDYLKGRGGIFPFVQEDPIASSLNNDVELQNWIYDLYDARNLNLVTQAQKDTVDSILSEYPMYGKTYRINFGLNTQSYTITPSPYPSTGYSTISLNYNFISVLWEYIDKMNTNLLIQEIHACLGAGESSYITDSQGNDKPVTMNVARKLDLLCKWQGLSVKFDGTYNRSQSSKYFPPGRPIPPGWYYDRTGVNGGFFEDSEMYKEVDSPLSIDDQRVGMAYQVRSNLGVETDEGLEIIKGGTVLCNNIVQYIDTMFDDLSKALDIEELGTGAITVGDKVFIYEGMLDILQEILFLVSDNNNNTEESKIAIGVTQQVTKEILKALGLPYGLSAFEYAIEGQGIDDIVDGKPLKRTSVSVPYPATLSGAPTLVDLLMAILANQGIQNISQISLKNSKLAELINQQSQ